MSGHLNIGMNSKALAELEKNNQETIKSFLIILFFLFPLMVFLCQPFLKDNLDYIEKYVWISLGFFYAIIVAHFPIHLTIKKIWIIFNNGTGYDKKSHFDSSEIVGYVERALFVVSIFYSRLELVAAWLVLKTAGRIWNQEKASFAESREIYQVFLIGSGLSIAYAFVGAKIMEWLPYHWDYALVSSIVLLLANLVIYFRIRPMDGEKYPKTNLQQEPILED